MDIRTPVDTRERRDRPAEIPETFLIMMMQLYNVNVSGMDRIWSVPFPIAILIT